MRILLILLLSAPLFCHGQPASDTLWGSKKMRTGLTIQTGMSFWKQSGLNSILSQDQLPAARTVNFMVGIGDMFRWNKFRMTGLFVFWRNKNSTGNENMEQHFGGGELNAEYFIIRQKGFSLSPLIGVGIMDGTTKIRRQAIAQSFSNSFVNRNTTELFNRQGFVNAGINFGFNYFRGLKEHVYQVAAGYRYGFSNTDWSTDPGAEVLSGSPTDALRQFYLSWKMNFMFFNRTRN